MSKRVNLQRVRNEIKQDHTGALYELIDKLKPAYICPFKITGGVLYQNARGEQGLDNELANFNAIFSGNNPIIVEWATAKQAYYYKQVSTYTNPVRPATTRYYKLPLKLSTVKNLNQIIDYHRDGTRFTDEPALIRDGLTLEIYKQLIDRNIPIEVTEAEFNKLNVIQDEKEPFVENFGLLDIPPGSGGNLKLTTTIYIGYSITPGSALEVKLTTKTTNIVLQREQSNVTNQEVVKAYKDGTLEVMVKASDWTNDLLFSLWTYPQQEQEALYYISTIVDYENGEGDTKYHQLTLKKVENSLSVLNGGTYQQYIHFYKPAQRFYSLPKYDAKTNTITADIREVEAAASLQIDILGKSLFSGMVLTTDTEPYIPFEALQPITTELDTYTNKQQRYVYILDAGLEKQGQLKDWKERVRADQGDLTARPSFEGVVTFNRVLGEAEATGNDGKYVIFNRDTTRYFKSYRYNVYTPPTIRYTDDIGLAYLFSSKNEADRHIRLVLRNRDGTLISQPRQGQVLREDTAAPLYGNSKFSFAQVLKTPNVEKNLQQETFTKALAANSLANLDTFFLPVEITQNYFMDLTTLPLIGGIIGALTFGVPAGTQTELSRTSTGFYDRKYNFITSITTKALLSDGFYGDSSNANRLAIDLDLPMVSDLGLSSSYHFSLGRTETIETSTRTPEGDFNKTYSKEFIQKNELDTIPTSLIIQAIGKVRYKVSFLSIDNKITWQGYFNSFARTSDDMTNWTTTIIF